MRWRTKNREAVAEDGYLGSHTCCAVLDLIIAWTMVYMQALHKLYLSRMRACPHLLPWTSLWI